MIPKMLSHCCWSRFRFRSLASVHELTALSASSSTSPHLHVAPDKNRFLPLMMGYECEMRWDSCRQPAGARDALNTPLKVENFYRFAWCVTLSPTPSAEPSEFINCVTKTTEFYLDFILSEGKRNSLFVWIIKISFCYCHLEIKRIFRNVRGEFACDVIRNSTFELQLRWNFRFDVEHQTFPGWLNHLIIPEARERTIFLSLQNTNATPSSTEWMKISPLRLSSTAKAALIFSLARRIFYCFFPSISH